MWGNFESASATKHPRSLPMRLLSDSARMKAGEENMDRWTIWAEAPTALGEMGQVIWAKRTGLSGPNGADPRHCARWWTQITKHAPGDSRKLRNKTLWTIDDWCRWCSLCRSYLVCSIVREMKYLSWRCIVFFTSCLSINYLAISCHFRPKLNCEEP